MVVWEFRTRRQAVVLGFLVPRQGLACGHSQQPAKLQELLLQSGDFENQTCKIGSLETAVVPAPLCGPTISGHSCKGARGIQNPEPRFVTRCTLLCATLPAGHTRQSLSCFQPFQTRLRGSIVILTASEGSCGKLSPLESQWLARSLRAITLPVGSSPNVCGSTIFLDLRLLFSLAYVLQDHEQIQSYAVESKRMRKPLPYSCKRLPVITYGYCNCALIL